nr:reverse transcriptase domain-containing protein [Tanacetum cinerariifolium]
MEDQSTTKEKARTERSKPRGKRSRHQETSSDSEHEEGSEDTYEDLNSPYKVLSPLLLPKESLVSNIIRGQSSLGTLGFEELSQKFLEEFSQQKRYAKDPTEIDGIRRQNEGLQAFMDWFKFKSSHIKGFPPVLCILAFMHGHGHPKLAKNLNEKILKMVTRCSKESEHSLEEKCHGVSRNGPSFSGRQRPQCQHPVKTQKMQSSAGRFFKRNVSYFRNNRSSSSYGKGRKKQNGTYGVRDNKMLFVIEHHNRKDRNETPHSGREALWECEYLERVQGSWKEVQWRQREEKMSRIREQVILRTKRSFGRERNLEREGIQIHVSYVSQPLQGMKICYTPMEKMLSRREGRLAKWAIEVWTYDISCFQRKEAEGSIVKKFFGQGEQLQERLDANEGEAASRLCKQRHERLAYLYGFTKVVAQIKGNHTPTTEQEKRRMIPEPGDAERDVNVNETFYEQTDDELSEKELKHIEADDQAIQTILLGLSEDIYATEKKAKLFNEWERFTSNEGESIESYYHRFLKLMNDLERNKHFPEKIASNLKFLNNLQPEWSRHVTIVHQTKDLHTADYTQLYDFLKYNQKEVDELKAKRLAKIQDPLALMAKSNNPYTSPASHQDLSPFNQNYMQQPITNPEDITDPTTAMNMALIGNGNLVAVRAEENAAGHNGNQIRCYNCRGVGHLARDCTVRPRRRDAAYLQTQLLIAQKEEAGIQLKAEEYDLMAAAADLDEIEEVNANCILMANLQQASSSGTQTDSAPVYDTDGSAEVHENYDNNEIYNMFTQEEQYTELLEPIPESQQIEADDQAIQTILLGLPEDIYAAVDSCETAKEIWLRVQQIMKGYDIGIQEKKAKLFNEWEREDCKQYEGDELKAERLAKTQDPLALMANSKNPYVFPAPHQDQSSFSQNYLQQPMSNPKDITDPTTAMNMSLTLMAKAFKLNYLTPTNNNQRISSNPRNRQIAQPGQNAGNSAGYNDVIENQIGNGNLVATRAKGNAAGQNGNQIRCYNCREVGHYARNCTVRPRRRDAAYLQTQLLIAQKEEAGIQLQAEEYDLMADAPDLDEIKEVNANCILMANLQQTSTSGTQTDSAPVYDTDGSTEVHENCDDNEIFNMFTQEEQYTELLEPIPKSHQIPQNDNNVISVDTSVEQ